MVTLLAVILGLLPGFAWLYFYLGEDPHPEPKRLVVATFFMGGAFAFFALVVQVLLNKTLGGIGIQQLSVISVIVLALVEEIFKFGAAFLTVHNNPAFDEPIDAMVYMVVAAMGFATVENMGAIQTPLGGTAVLTSVFSTISLRFIGATLLHALTSAVVGYYWAQRFKEMGTHHVAFVGIAVATALHAVFNCLILSSADNSSFVYAIIFIVAAGFFILNDFEALKGPRTKDPAAEQVS